MKKRLKLLCLFSFLFIALLSFSIADVGNFNSYDSDWGSSSWDYDSDWGSSSWDYDSDWSSGYVAGSAVSSLSGSVFTCVLIWIFVIVIIYVFKNSNGKNSNRSGNVSTPKSNPVKSDLYQINVVERIQKNDQYFSEEKFKAWVNEVFIKLQTAWTARDWSGIRPFESEELFSLHKAQLQQYIDRNRINVIDRISVRNTELINYSVDGDKELLIVDLQATMKDYIVDANTQDVLEGDKDRYWEMKYYLTFMRKKGVKTDPSTSNKSTTNCPNCGAPTEITSAGKCPYCRSVITTGEHDWVLTKMESHR